MASQRQIQSSDQKTEQVSIPPHSTEAEQAVLGGIMLSNQHWDGIAERGINTFHVITERGCDDMKPSDFQKTIQCQFDCKLKRVVKGIVRNYRKELKRRRNKEISYCELPEIVVEKLAVWDEYESDYTAFDVCGIEVRVLDDDLAEAIKYLSEKDREILLMYFFLGMSDTEIGDRLKINRSTSFRSRKNSLEEIKKKLKENMNDE